MAKKDCIEVKTQAGVLRAYKSADPYAPGIVLMLQPKGFDFEIDLANVEVKEDPAYVTVDCETPEDVCIYTFGDVSTEDYTMKNIIRRADLLSVLP